MDEDTEVTLKIPKNAEYVLRLPHSASKPMDEIIREIIEERVVEVAKCYGTVYVYPRVRPAITE